MKFADKQSAIKSEDRCPEYRLRLFLSADLTGSTAYKSNAGAEMASGLTTSMGQSHRPKWVFSLREFYREFPRILSRCFQKTAGARDLHLDALHHAPEVWKLVGDEILFSCRIVSHQHLCVCSSAFVSALLEYGIALERSGQGLDIKGAAWTAAFPATNVTVVLKRRDGDHEQETEADELGADKKPDEFDFLGPGIDTGFRIARFASPDRLALSLELAYLLAEGDDRGLHSCHFNYHNRESLKGVIRERPYPIVSIDTQRSHSKKRLMSLENVVRSVPHFSSSHLAAFLLAFIRDAGLELPHLPGAGLEGIESVPPSYIAFRKGWEEQSASLQQVRAREQEAAEQSGGAANPAQDQLLDEILSSIPDYEPEDWERLLGPYPDEGPSEPPDWPEPPEPEPPPF